MAYLGGPLDTILKTSLKPTLAKTNGSIFRPVTVSKLNLKSLVKTASQVKQAASIAAQVAKRTADARRKADEATRKAAEQAAKNARRAQEQERKIAEAKARQTRKLSEEQAKREKKLYEQKLKADAKAAKAQADQAKRTEYDLEPVGPEQGGTLVRLRPDTTAEDAAAETLRQRRTDAVYSDGTTEVYEQGTGPMYPTTQELPEMSVTAPAPEKPAVSAAGIGIIGGLLVLGLVLGSRRKS